MNGESFADADAQATRAANPRAARRGKVGMRIVYLQAATMRHVRTAAKHMYASLHVRCKSKTPGAVPGVLHWRCLKMT
jgi:hypothetical protein